MLLNFLFSNYNIAFEVVNYFYRPKKDISRINSMFNYRIQKDWIAGIVVENEKTNTDLSRTLCRTFRNINEKNLNFAPKEETRHWEIRYNVSHRTATFRNFPSFLFRRSSMLGNAAIESGAALVAYHRRETPKKATRRPYRTDVNKLQCSEITYNVAKSA